MKQNNFGALNVPVNAFIDLGRAFTALIALHTDEELIRLRRRAQNAGEKGLAKVLADEIEKREETAKKLSELNL